jgi:hypothetical protein
MHPQLFLKAFWRMELRPQIFVAMSFADRYKSRFEDIIAPAICSISVDGINLEPYRVDLSKSGDPILIDIMDGIAHCQMVLADVSSIGKDSVTGQPYRNGNVMYEVGLALACRQPAEVLLIRDDRDKFLFDVSTIPHMTIDFTDTDSAITVLRDELKARLKERNYINDARVQLAVASLSCAEVGQLRHLADLPPEDPRIIIRIPRKDFSSLESLEIDWSVSRLLDKQLIKITGGHDIDKWFMYLGYELTPFGHIVAELVKSSPFLSKVQEQHKSEATNARDA